MPIKKPLILIVDDSVSDRLILSDGLANEGFDVCEAENGVKALEAFETSKPDIVIMDVQMPEKDGFAALIDIRKIENERRTPVLMLTASDDVESINKAFNSGASDYMPKPINLPLLLLRLKFILRDIKRDAMFSRVEQQKENASVLFGLVYWEFSFKTKEINISFANGKKPKWFSESPEFDSDFLSLMHPKNRQQFVDDIKSAVDNNKPFDVEVVCEVEQVKRTLRLVGQSDPERNFISGAAQDITESKNLKRQTHYLSYFDSLTGLPNQNLFMRSVEICLTETEQKNVKAIVFVLELTNLASITSAYGNAVVETLIRRIASELKRLMPNNAVCSRLDSTFFAVTFTVRSSIMMKNIITKLHQQLSQLNRSWVIAGREIYIKLSAGVVESRNDDNNSPSSMIRMAKSANYETKSNAELSINKYDENTNQAMKKRLSLESELYRAFEKDEFKIQYQPQIDVETRKVVGVEALLRLQSSNIGMVSPGDFIPVLEESGLIVEVGDSVLRKAAMQQLAWCKQGLELRVGVNLSAVQFKRDDLPERISSIIKEVGVPESMIELEVTESATVEDPQHAIDVMQRLRKSGFQIALDDFGTGYSSFEYLLNFELDKLKIDKAFIDNIADDRKNRALINSMIYMSSGLNLKTIAEGVESKRQFDFLDALGIDEIQGFLFSKPLWPDEIFAFSEKFNKLPHHID